MNGRLGRRESVAQPATSQKSIPLRNCGRKEEPLCVRREQGPSTAFLGDREPEEPRPHRRVLPPDFVWHEPDRDIQGYEQAKQFVSSFFEAFPDISISVEDVIGEGDQVVSRYTIRGTTKERRRSLVLPPTSR